MSNPNDPAYPLYVPEDRECPPEIDHGMTIRQEFVKAVMQGLCANSEITGDEISNSNIGWYATKACELADAALAEEARTRSTA